MTKLEKVMLVVVVVWVALMLIYGRQYYPVTDAEMMRESLKWGLP